VKCALDANYVRLAFAPHSTLLFTFVDGEHEMRELAGVVGGSSTGVDAYIERPFAFPVASRFSTGAYGVLYAANSIHTAVRETAYHLAQFFASGNAPESERRRTRLRLRMRGTVEELRRANNPRVDPAIYDPNDYASAQRLGAQLRPKRLGVGFDSVRNLHGGTCVGAFTPSLVARAAIVGEMSLVWNGRRFTEAHDITPI